MNKFKMFIWLFALVTIILLFLMVVVVAYGWGYMQSAIDHHVAYFSAPANFSLINGIPFLIGAIITGSITFVFYQKSK